MKSKKKSAKKACLPAGTPFTVGELEQLLLDLHNAVDRLESFDRACERLSGMQREMLDARDNSDPNKETLPEDKKSEDLWYAVDDVVTSLDEDYLEVLRDKSLIKKIEKLAVALIAKQK